MLIPTRISQSQEAQLLTAFFYELHPRGICHEETQRGT